MRKPKILVVEDEKDVARIISINLQLENMEVVQVHDGKDALPAIRSEMPDCVVLDIMLPHISGWQILKSLSAAHELAEIPVVVVTARVNERDQLRGLGGGAVKYITKPFNPDDLTEAIKDSLDSQAKKALIIERRQVIERLQLSTLHKISQILISAPGYMELLKGVSEKLVSLFELSACAVILGEKDDREPEVYLFKTTPSKKDTSTPGQQARVPRALMERLKQVFGGSPRPVRIKDVDSILLESIPPSPQSFSSGYLLPLFSHSKLLGVIILCSKTDLVFSLDEEDLLVTIANQVAVALERAILHESVKKEQLLQRYLLQETITAQEKERKRIASEIHDSLIQAMVGISYQLQVIQNKISDDGVSEDLHAVREKLMANIKEVRRLIHGLRPSLLDDLGLVSALEEYLKEFGNKNSVQTDLRIPADMPKLTSEAETTMYRIIQEALNNVEKHSDAVEISVEIEATPDKLYVSVKDDGRGFQVSEVERIKDRSVREMLETKMSALANVPAQVANSGGQAAGSNESSSSTHLGIAIMRERAELLGGTLKVDSRPNTGTTVVLEVPLSPVTKAEV